MSEVSEAVERLAAIKLDLEPSGAKRDCNCDVCALKRENFILRDMLLNPNPDDEPDVIRLHREKCDALDEVTRLRSALEEIAEGMLHFRAPHRLAECMALARRTLDAVGPKRSPND